MEVLVAFLLSFFFSFIGSIPPGTLNLTILQLGLEHKMNIAWRFAIASAMVEYSYAWLAIKFEQWITTTPLIVENLQLITAIVMTVLGLFNLWSENKPTKFSQQFSKSGFRRGIVLSILNPLALPYWLGITAYLKSQRWVELSSTLTLQSYLVGVVSGSLLLLVLLAYLATRIASRLQQYTCIKRVPGIMLLILGAYAFVQYLM